MDNWARPLAVHTGRCQFARMTQNGCCISCFFEGFGRFFDLIKCGAGFEFNACVYVFFVGRKAAILIFSAF